MAAVLLIELLPASGESAHAPSEHRPNGDIGVKPEDGHGSGEPTGFERKRNHKEASLSDALAVPGEIVAVREQGRAVEVRASLFVFGYACAADEITRVMAGGTGKGIGRAR